MKTIDFTLPDFWADPLINGDDSGMEEDDCVALDAFVEFMVGEYGSCQCLDVANDSNFMRNHDASDFGVLACDASTFTFAI